MKNPFESPEEIPLTEQGVIGVLDANKINAVEAIEALGRYADQCHAEADAEAQGDPESAIASNRANLKAEIKIALVYMKSKEYKSMGRESLEETLLVASQDEATHDLTEQIISILNSN